MSDDVLLSKAATLERCIKRIREEYDKAQGQFDTNYTNQDAAILNIERACETTLDIGQHIIRKYKLGNPQTSRDIFSILEENKWIDQELSDNLKKMVGFRNVAIHNYRDLQLPIVVSVIEQHLNEFIRYSEDIIYKDAHVADKATT